MDFWMFNWSLQNLAKFWCLSDSSSLLSGPVLPLASLLELVFPSLFCLLMTKWYHIDLYSKITKETRLSSVQIPVSLSFYFGVLYTVPQTSHNFPFCLKGTLLLAVCIKRTPEPGPMELFPAVAKAVGLVARARLGFRQLGGLGEGPASLLCLLVTQTLK